MVEPISFISSISKIITAAWSNGSRFLWSVAGGAAAAVVVIRVGVYLGIPKAQPWWDDYGLILILLAVVVAVFAAFKMRAERRNTGLVLIADEQQRPLASLQALKRSGYDAIPSSISRDEHKREGFGLPVEGPVKLALGKSRSNTSLEINDGTPDAKYR